MLENNEVAPDTWLALLSELFAGDWYPELHRHRSRYVFRGVIDSTWDMQTSLMRLDGEYRSLEKHLLRNFAKYAHRDVVDRNSLWHWLSVAQHHGLPTRILDWTYSPLVALHFATDSLEAMDRCGAVWVVDVGRVHANLPDKLRNALVREASAVFTVDMLADELEDPLEGRRSGYAYADGLSSFDSLKDDDFALFFEPPSMDDRIVNQFALFSVFSDPSKYLNHWLAGQRNSFKKVVITDSLKWEIRDKLDQSNITERVIYPGLDGLSRWLKRHYSPSKAWAVANPSKMRPKQ